MRPIPKHARGILPVIAAGALFLAGCQNVGSGSTAPSDGASIPVSLAHTDAGDALSGAGGMTLYILTTDTSTTSSCTGGCATTWPPLTGIAGDVAAGNGVSGTFGTITRDDGSQQVTYNGHPLYYYSGDSAPGDANGEGSGGVWFIAPVGADGSASQPAQASATPYRQPAY